jgi:hypothetical protein
MTDVSAFDVEKEVYKRVNEEIIPSLEPGTTLQIVYNDVDYIKALVGALKEHLYLGTLLTAIIVFIFLGSFVSTIIISIAIPVSLLAAVFFMYVMGYTFNSITMLALLLLIGVVVDDAIVVLENIYRNMENGKNRIKAAIEGTEEVIFPVLAATLSLVCIFGPVIFMEGMVGRFFRSFAVVITFGVIASYFVSVIVTPMLCSRFMTISHNKKNFFSIFEIILKKIEKYYVYILQFCLRSRITVMILVIGLFFTSFLFMSKVGKDFIPEGDESNFSILVITPLGTSIHANINKAKEIENLISKNKEVRGVQVNIGRNAQAVNRMDIDVYLIPIEKRKVSYKEVMKKVREQLATVVGIEYSTFVKSGASGGEKLQFYLKSTNFKELLDAVFVFDKNLKQNDMFKNVILKLRVDYPQVIFDLDQTSIAELEGDTFVSKYFHHNTDGTQNGFNGTGFSTNTNRADMFHFYAGIWYESKNNYAFRHYDVVANEVPYYPKYRLLHSETSTQKGLIDYEWFKRGIGYNRQYSASNNFKSQFSKPLFFYTLVTFLVTFFDRFILLKNNKFDEQAFYGIAFRLSSISFFLISALTQLLIREFVLMENEFNKIQTIFKKKYGFTFMREADQESATRYRAANRVLSAVVTTSFSSVSFVVMIF